MNSVESFANHLLKVAIDKNASDIHMIPRKDHFDVRLRIGTKLLSYRPLPIKECDRLISHFKFTASMDIGEKRKPQNGSFTANIDGKLIGFRLSSLPVKKKESLVIRILPHYTDLSVYQISLFPKMAEKLLSLLQHAHGLIILTGPTGSGKSTTLYNLLNEASRRLNKNIISIEDPIEKENEGFLQVQVNEKTGITYRTGLKAILRHDPDIIMVGEIRDKETAKIAIRASLTGHLVLTTMHTRNAIGAIYRLLEFGVAKQEIEQTIVAVTAQRLVERTCPYCETNECTPFCFSYNLQKRGVVFELLTGTDLKKAVQGEGNLSFPTLKQLIRKGIALGFIQTNEYEKWVLESETS